MGTTAMIYSTQLLNILIRLDDDLTGKILGFEAMSDRVSSVLTEIGLACGGKGSGYMLAVWDLLHGPRLAYLFCRPRHVLRKRTRGGDSLGDC